MSGGALNELIKYWQSPEVLVFSSGEAKRKSFSFTPVCSLKKMQQKFQKQISSHTIDTSARN
jgi:hypothetical protein